MWSSFNGKVEDIIIWETATDKSPKREADEEEENIIWYDESYISNILFNPIGLFDPQIQKACKISNKEMLNYEINSSNATFANVW